MRGRAPGIAAALAAITISAPARTADPTPEQCASSYESAQLLRQGGHLVAARDAALVCARASCPRAARKDCEAWVIEITREIPTVTVVSRAEGGGDDRGVRVLVDGVPRAEAASGRAFEVDPGSHVFRVERPGEPPAEQTVSVVQGEHGRILRLLPERPSAPPAPPEQRRSYVPAFVVGGIAAAFLGVSAGLGLSGRSDLSHLRATCAPACTDEQVSPVRLKLLFSDLALAAGIASAGVSIYLFARPPTVAPASTVQLVIAPARAGAALSVRGAF